MQKAYTLKIRGGRSGYMKDGKLITAGKGALIQIEKSATLGTSQDQTVFVPIKSICLNDQGGAIMNVTIGKTETLRAQTHGHASIIFEERYSESIDTEEEYVARRLTPTECARLQGFPDDWCSDVPHSDSAEYKLWGNGIALPTILPMMKSMADILRKGGD